MAFSGAYFSVSSLKTTNMTAFSLRSKAVSMRLQVRRVVPSRNSTYSDSVNVSSTVHY